MFERRLIDCSFPKPESKQTLTPDITHDSCLSVSLKWLTAFSSIPSCWASGPQSDPVSAGLCWRVGNLTSGFRLALLSGYSILHSVHHVFLTKDLSYLILPGWYLVRIGRQCGVSSNLLVLNHIVHSNCEFWRCGALASDGCAFHRPCPRHHSRIHYMRDDEACPSTDEDPPRNA